MKSESISSSLEMDKLNISTDETAINPRNGPKERRSYTQPPLQNNDEIENEIDRLKKESSLIKASQDRDGRGVDEKRSVLNKSKSSSFSSASTNQELAASSLQTSSHFDKKIQHIENYSQIIENATQNMDDCVKHMSSLYENYEKIYNDANVESDMLASGEENRSNHFAMYDKTKG